jgi:CDP-paratose 2-epimerase
MTRILVTGGAGFVGSHLAEHFAKNDHEVVIYDNLSRAETLGKSVGQKRHNWNYISEKFPQIKCLEADVRDFQAVREASKFARVIVHTAGQVAVTTSLRDPRTDFEANALGTFNMLEAARLNDSALVFCSTNKVYGENVNHIPVKEQAKRYVFDHPNYVNGIPENFSTDHTGHSPYGSSKLAADNYVQDYAYSYGLKTGVFRMSCIYGERQFGVEDQGWLAWFAIACLTGKPITIYGNGKQVRDTLYVKDLVEAFDLFIRSKLKHVVFNMGGGPRNTLSVLELLDILQDVTSAKPGVSFSEWRPADQRVYISDIRKAQEMLHWKPKVAPQEGVKRLVNWVRENRHLFN